jgi:hypothetical protein
VSWFAAEAAGANVDDRGIPSGYLSFVEQQLFDTELVAIELLSAIYNSPTPIELQRLFDNDRLSLAEYSQKQSKAAKFEEWKSLPLNTDEQRHGWWSKRCRSMSSPAHQGPEGASQDAPTPQEMWLDASPISVQYDDIQQHSAMQIGAQSASTTTAWHKPMNMVVPDTFEPLSNGSPVAFGAPLMEMPSIEGSASNTQRLTAERLRKYFKEVSMLLRDPADNTSLASCLEPVILPELA